MSESTARRSLWSRGVSYVRSWLGTEQLGHGRGYHGMFQKWDAGVANVRKLLGVRADVGIHADTRASIFSNLRVIQLASLPHQGQVDLVTDSPNAAAVLRSRGVGNSTGSPVRIRATDNFLNELGQAGRVFYSTHSHYKLNQALNMIQNLHSDSILVLELNKLNAAQNSGSRNRNLQIGKLANLLQDEAARLGKRVVLLHGLDRENLTSQPAVALYSPKLWGTVENPGEGRIHAPLAGPVGLIRDVYRRLKNPKATARPYETVDHETIFERIRNLLNQERSPDEQLGADDFGVIHTRAGFGGDQLTLAAGLLNGVFQARSQRKKFTPVPTVLHLPNYWRVQSEFLKAANLAPKAIVADEFLNRDHGAFLDAIRENKRALVYLENPTNPQGRRLTPEAVIQVLQAAKKSGSVVVEDMTLVSPNETPEERLRHLNEMIRMSNRIGVKYLAIASASKYTGNPEAKIGAVFSSRKAKHLIEPFSMPVSREEAAQFDKFISKGFRAAEAKEKNHMIEAYETMARFAARPDTLHQLVQPEMDSLVPPDASSFKMFKLHLPSGMTVADLVANNPQLKDFDPKPLHALCGGVKPPGVSDAVWKEWATFYRLSPVSVYATRKGVLEIEKAAKAAWKESGVDGKTLKRFLPQRKAELQRRAQAAADRMATAV